MRVARVSRFRGNESGVRGLQAERREIQTGLERESTVPERCNGCVFSDVLLRRRNRHAMRIFPGTGSFGFTALKIFLSARNRSSVSPLSMLCGTLHGNTFPSLLRKIMKFGSILKQR